MVLRASFPQLTYVKVTVDAETLYPWCYQVGDRIPEPRPGEIKPPE
jgi:hypothetical protein